MSLGKGDPVPLPPDKGEYHIKFGTRAAAEGWQQLSAQATGNTRDAWFLMRTQPAPTVPNPRHHQLRGDLAYGKRGGEFCPQWQLEVTGGGRVWYLFDEKRQTCWVVYAGTGHPSATDK
ncbi:hypothetical protein ACIO6U_02800 [Streptomyces sp. NPDC087422]|uniref:hypothetical protein n=1 Tax=Streptomyces sp. NPDC087422 TaxID=3365786 RepID=UPI00380BCF67